MHEKTIIKRSKQKDPPCSRFSEEQRSTLKAQTRSFVVTVSNRVGSSLPGAGKPRLAEVKKKNRSKTKFCLKFLDKVFLT